MSNRPKLLAPEKHRANAFLPIRIVHPSHNIIGGIAILVSEPEYSPGTFVMHTRAVPTNLETDSRVLNELVDLLADTLGFMDRVRVALRILRGTTTPVDDELCDE